MYCFPHILHEKGFSPVWVTKCLFIVVTQTNFLPQTAQTGKILEDFFLAPERDNFKNCQDFLQISVYTVNIMLMSAAGFYILCRGPSIEIYTSTHKNSPYYYCLVLATHLDNITLLLYTIDKNLDSPGGVIKEN